MTFSIQCAEDVDLGIELCVVVDGGFYYCGVKVDGWSG
jgi:hypothetical protein